MPPLKKPTPYWGRPEHLHRRLEEEHDERMKQRLTAILLLMEGQPQAEVAQELNVSTATLRIWRRRWNQGGVAHLEPRWSGSAAMAEVRQVMRKYGRDIQKLSDTYAAIVPIKTGPLWMIEKCKHIDKRKTTIFRNCPDAE